MRTVEDACHYISIFLQKTMTFNFLFSVFNETRQSDKLKKGDSMDIEKWSLRVGAVALACAVLFRLGSDGVFHTAAQAMATPEAVAVMMFLESGRVVRPAPVTAPLETVPLEQPQDSYEEPMAQAVFASVDADLVEVNSYCGIDPDVPAMIQKPLSWNLQQEKPTVLIVHSHGSESYQKTEDYEESSYYRTLNRDYNMISIGAEVKKILEAGGVGVIHDTQMHDQPSYNDSYNQSRKSVKEYLKKYPSICLVLDLHRDAVENKNGEQVAVTAKHDGKTAAQLMLVVGTDVRLSHPDWPENMSLAVKLHAQLEKNFPGICRPISFRSQRFNQDLCSGALLVEVGAAGNTREEALEAARVLGRTVLELSRGAVVQ